MPKPANVAERREDPTGDAMPPLTAFLPDPLGEFAMSLSDAEDEVVEAIDMSGSRLRNLGTDLNVVVVGASGGIGSALTALLDEDPAVGHVFAFSRSGSPRFGDKIVAGRVDVALESSIERAAGAAAEAGPIHAVFVATGRLDDGGEGSDLLAYDAAAMALAYQVNTIGPMLVAKHFIPRMAPKSVFAVLSDDVRRFESNYDSGWQAYRASKAALNALVRSLSRQLAERGIETICAGLHPGTVDTPLSQSLRPLVSEDELVAPDVAAERLIEVANGLSPAQNGHVVAWDGSVLSR